ncbi:hypothetical protein SAMN04487783_1543 [Agrococcus baldri]|uniref:Uncharacterized protein n=1 Tax=Agrococcus baldri TaxID=153730 RepID=A0AA94HMJ3_9MICO|nr:hypothetical protein [Agrococcus baldri]SFS11251.1 hypothetical protein SAMN04487783_1543 [Agrococcus baldri]
MPELANGQYVSQADAVRQWWPAAREVLVETARDYGAWITHDGLSERIQASTGITTRHPAEEWIDRVLGRVGADAQQRGEPQLTSLCVTAERRIGSDYPGVPAGTDERTRERVAAEDRLACYRHFGATIPADGGSPVVLAPLPERAQRQPRRTATGSTAHSRPSTASAAPTPALKETTCLNCFMVVPVAATCRDCGEPLPG